MKRIPCLILLLALLSNLYGCGGSVEAETEAPAASDVQTSVEEPPAEPDDKKITDDLPAISLDGVTINMLVREETKDEFAAEMDGDVIDAAVYGDV